MRLKPPTITFREKYAELGDIQSFIFDYDSSFTWTPGQFISIFVKVPGVRKPQKHAFSIASILDEGRILISTRVSITDPSEYKQSLGDLSPGDKLTVHGPHGRFTLNNDEKPVLLIAGGIGVTPMRAMLMDAKDLAPNKPIHLVYIQSQSQFIYQDDFEKIAESSDRITITYLSSSSGLGPIIKDAAKECDFYVSGPPKMVDGVAMDVADIGVSKKNIHKDGFLGY